MCGCKFVEMPGPASVCSFQQLISCKDLLNDQNTVLDVEDYYYYFTDNENTSKFFNDPSGLVLS